MVYSKFNIILLFAYLSIYNTKAGPFEGGYFIFYAYIYIMIYYWFSYLFNQKKKLVENT